MKYDVFLSYRRKGGSERAELLKAILVKHGYDEKRIFMDTHSLRGGDFRAKLTAAIENSNNVVVLITKGCFDGVKEDDTWIYEIAKSLELNKNIVPVFFDEIQAVDGVNLPKALKDLPSQNAVSYNHEYADAFYEKFLSFLVKEKPSSKRKVLKRKNKDKDQEEDDNQTNVILKDVLMLFLIVLAAFLMFASIGFGVGYFGTREKPNELINKAITSKKLVVVDKTTVSYTGNIVDFSYNIENDSFDFRHGDQTILDNITFEAIVMSVSLSFMFSRLFKYAEHAGNSKTRVAILIGGSIGILCGYSIGNYIGKDYALSKNDKDISKFIRQKEAKAKILQYINMYYND